MIQSSVPGTLGEDIARAVAELPGVAFLKPGLAGRLRTALARPEPAVGGAASAGVRLTRPNGDGGVWHVEVQFVALRRARTVDVARAARKAVEAQLAQALPAQAEAARITVTVTGLV